MNLNRNLIFLATLLVGFVLGGCQNETVEIIEPLNESVLNAESPIVNLVQQATQHDGSWDNIIDNSSCSSVVLPVSVIANGVPVEINSVEDLLIVERIFDEAGTQPLSLEIVFPITVLLNDHTEKEINNYQELIELAEFCIEGGEDEDIECVDFDYPLTISIYNSENQLSDVVTVNDDEQLYKLFKALKESELVSFNFPLTLLLKDGSEVVVQNNDELKEVIEDYAEECDEDDDNDYSDDDIDDSDLKAVLLEGEWEITYFFDEKDETGDFNDFRFKFY